jgi:hypothetical protein
MMNSRQGANLHTLSLFHGAEPRPLLKVPGKRLVPRQTQGNKKDFAGLAVLSELI